MKYTAVLSLFLVGLVAADLPYGMPNGRREVERAEPPKPTGGHDHGHGHGHGGGTGGGYPHPTGTGGGFPTGTGGHADPTDKPHYTHVKEAEPEHTTFQTHRKPHGTGHGGHGTGHGTGYPTGTGEPHKPTETGIWHGPGKPTQPIPQI